ncbi:unnamed protein product, partial [Ectocarpus fasciculatus]
PTPPRLPQRPHQTAFHRPPPPTRCYLGTRCPGRPSRAADLAWSRHRRLPRPQALLPLPKQTLLGAPRGVLH